MSAGGPAKLNGAETILAVAADPASAERLADGELGHAFASFGIDPLAGLRQLYLRGGFHKLDLRRDTSRLTPFVAAFLACYPIGHEYFSVRSAVTQWLALSESCPMQTRAEFQLCLVRDHVPSHFLDETLTESRRIAFLPEAEARIREIIVSEAKPSTRYVPPEDAAEDEDDAPVLSAATKRARGGRYGASLGRWRRRRETGGLPIMLVVLGVVLVAAMIVGIVYLMNDRDAKPEQPALKEK
jgi:hypothetical protein